MTILRISLILLLICCFQKIHSQVIVFRTYEDFKNERGEKYDEYNSYLMSMGKVTLSFLRDNNKYKIKCKDIYGFIYKDVLFRIDEFSKQPARLMSHGKIFYYENGLGHLDILKHNKETGLSPSPLSVFFSKSINTPVVATGTRKPYNNFKKYHPEYNELFNCIDESRYYVETGRRCVAQFEGFESEEE